ncbi:acyl-CoA dehydrogenase [Variovorax boronicumulans]|uniref:Acyl-[acyl-carrier-protein] dehydrogenase MbtN n=2 Tax=Variovorax boronicumulans TaxID=436515 RepID=A0AAW8DUF8_9BURK|nr:acyl-CoA dehydrogenase [Variovorax boronicumulans]MDP9922947.1 acyl-CoA dehydrogenase [Variovorax boronicumulans]
MTDDMALFRQTVRRFVERELAPQEERFWKQGHVDRDTWLQAGAAGVLLPSIPQDYGGGGGSFGHDAIVITEQARAGVSSLGTSVHSAIVAHYLLTYGSEEQKRLWLPRMASGELVVAIAMTEPGAGTDLQGIQTRAQREGGDYVINGSKTFITNGLMAGLIVVVCQTRPEAGARGLSLIVVETEGLKGFRRGRLLEKIGMKGRDTTELFFDDVHVPAGNLLGAAEGEGFRQLMQQLPKERMIIALEAQALMERALSETIAYVRERRMFGQALIDMQNTRFKLAECKTQAAIAKVFVDDCMHRLLAGELDLPTAAMAKWWCTQKNCEIIDECLQLHGGYGYMLEYPIAKLYANARVSKIYGGSNEIMKELIARSL